MKIMTFNIQHAFDYKNQVIDTDLFADKIRLHGADICGLNEVRGEGPIEDYTDQTDAIADNLGFERYFARAIMVEGTSPYGNAIVSRYKIVSAETVSIPDPLIKMIGGHYESRCVLKAVIDCDGKEICVLVCHMGLTPAQRSNAVKTICDIVDGTDLPLILMGDFNTTPKDIILKPLYKRLKDTDSVAESKGMKTYPSYGPDIKIDYIFYRGLECKNVKTVTEVYSDHFPIIAEFY